MISGVDYKERTRTRFVIYAVIFGPLLGLLFCLVLLVPFGLFERFFGIGQHRPIAFLPVMLAFQWFFPIGTGPALVTGLLAMRQFTRKGEVLLGDLLASSVLGASFGNFAAMVLTLKLLSGERSDIVSLPVLIFLIALPLLLSSACAYLLWRFRPANWIGPLSKEELAVWRSEQGAVNQSHE